MIENRVSVDKSGSDSKRRRDVVTFQFKVDVVKTRNEDVNQAKSEQTADKNFDPIETSIGSFGRWQTVTVLLLFLLKFPSVWHQLGIVFLAPPVVFNCSVPDNVTDKCSPTCKKYEYDRSVFEETVITQWNLVCGRAGLASWMQTCIMMGMLVGSLIFGYLSDKYGRKRPLILAVIFQATTGLAAAFSSSLWMLFVLKFLSTLATAGTIVIAFVLVTEIAGNKWRAVVSVLIHLPFSLGYLMLALFGYYIRHWKYFQMAISLPSVLFISYHWLLPESPRWLIAVGRQEKVITVLERAANHNRLPTETIRANVEKAFDMKNVRDDESTGAGKFVDLIRTPNLRKRTLIVCYCWFVDGICFFGVAQYFAQMKGDIFLNVVLFGAAQIPGILLTVYLIQRWGRRSILMCFSAMTGTACIAIPLVHGAAWIEMMLSVVGALGLMILSVTLYTYTSELFPTVVRNVGLGLAIMCARIGSMFAPFVASSLYVNPSIPPLVFGTGQFSATLLFLLLPETMNTPLSDTIQEGEEFGKRRQSVATNLII